MTHLPPFDLDAYLERIGYLGDRAPTAAVLRAVHLGHSTQIPFENVDLFLGLPVPLDLASLQAKLVGARRGGVCYEQNFLLAAALEALGFRVTPVAAHVRKLGNTDRPRSHMLLLVEAEGAPYVADCGFGYDGLMEPLPLTADAVQEQYGWAYRLVREGPRWVLQLRQPQGWRLQYVFPPEPLGPENHELPITPRLPHPGPCFVDLPPTPWGRRFADNLLVQRPTAEARYVLQNRKLLTLRPEGTESQAIADEDQLRRTLAEVFGLVLPDGVGFPLWGSGG